MEQQQQQQQQQVYAELEQAVYDLSSRCLHTAARWAAEQMAGLEPQLFEHVTAGGNPKQPVRMDPVDRAPQYMLAKEHFSFKEYRRAAHVLEGLSGPKALFLKCWCLYLAGEKRREEEREEAGDGKGGADASHTASYTASNNMPKSSGILLLGSTKGNGGPVNQELGGIETALRGAVHDGSADAFCAFLLGQVLLDKGKNSDAQELLLASVRKYPVNWSAWMGLQRLVVESHSLQILPSDPGALPSHWMADFFIAAASLELQQNMEALARLQHLSQVFPQSLAVEAFVAQAHYNLQNFEEAQVLFEDLLNRDPYRLEGTDTFSNILFVKEQPAALSLLAHRAMSTDKYRAETCCVVGNFYSLKGQHEQAVVWFRRALRLQRTCLAAWTLMGHEYMEMKNTAAAIEAYRAAVELSSHDYRAWYGLGQAHELLKLPFYALYYYRRAAALRPGDARMWCALGQCYAHEQVGAEELALRCYQRAVEQQDPEGVALQLLAKLHESRGELEEAERLYRANLARLDAEAGGLAGGPGAPPLSSDAVDALLFLANHCKATGRLSEAKEFCERLMDVGGPAREQAKALAREIHTLTAQEQQQQAALLQQPQQAYSSMNEAAQASGLCTTFTQDAMHAGNHRPGLMLHSADATSTPQGAVVEGAWRHWPLFAGSTTGATNMQQHDVAGRNLMSALGNAIGSRQVGMDTSTQQTGMQGRHAGRGVGARHMTPLPAPLFGGTPGPGSAFMDNQRQVATPPTGNSTVVMMEACTPDPLGLQTPGAGAAHSLTGWHAGASFMQEPDARRQQPMEMTPCTSTAATLHGLVHGAGDMSAATALGQPAGVITAQRARQQDSTQGCSSVQAQQVQSRVQAQQAVTPQAVAGGTGHEAVLAVSQQLRVSEQHAAMLLAAAEGDPVAAIRQNLHLLRPVLPE